MGLPFAWFTVGEACRDDGRPEVWLEENMISSVVAVASDHWVPAGAGQPIRARGGHGPEVTVRYSRISLSCRGAARSRTRGTRHVTRQAQRT
jgi:hypothetical protein